MIRLVAVSSAFGGCRDLLTRPFSFRQSAGVSNVATVFRQLFAASRGYIRLPSLNKSVQTCSTLTMLSAKTPFQGGRIDSNLPETASAGDESSHRYAPLLLILSVRRSSFSAQRSDNAKLLISVEDFNPKKDPAKFRTEVRSHPPTHGVAFDR